MTMTEAKPEKKRVPLRPGRFKIPNEPGVKPYLVASRCRSCGKYFSPTRAICLNCGKREMEEVALGGRGKVYTYTLAHQQLPGALVKVPYAIANITMDEGCQVQTVVTEGWESIDIGQEMEVYFEKVREDAMGNEEIAYKFRLRRNR
jgi:uncharacterized OB-fold protein